MLARLRASELGFVLAIATSSFDTETYQDLSGNPLPNSASCGQTLPRSAI